MATEWLWPRNAIFLLIPFAPWKSASTAGGVVLSSTRLAAMLVPEMLERISHRIGEALAPCASRFRRLALDNGAIGGKPLGIAAQSNRNIAIATKRIRHQL